MWKIASNYFGHLVRMSPALTANIMTYGGVQAIRQTKEALAQKCETTRDDCGVIGLTLEETELLTCMGPVEVK